MAAVEQRGFTLIQLAIYAGIFLAVAGVIGGAVHMVKKWGADEVRAELQPKLDACQAAVAAQNAAVEAMRAEAAKKQAAASQALAKASEKAKVWEDNAARLRAILTAPRPAGEAAPTDCKTAWQEIRKP